MLDEESTIKAVQLIEHLHKRVDEKTVKTSVLMILTSNEDSMHLANLRDYFMFFAFEATKEESQKFLSWNIFQYIKTDEYELFFFVIDNILRLRHQIPSIPMENLSKDVFLDSFKETRDRYKLRDLECYQKTK